MYQGLVWVPISFSHMYSRGVQYNAKATHWCTTMRPTLTFTAMEIGSTP
jgi:hypothetical protein